MEDATVKMRIVLEKAGVKNANGDMFTEEALKSAIKNWNKKNKVSVRDNKSKRIIGIVHDMQYIPSSGDLEALVEINRDVVEQKTKLILRDVEIEVEG